MIYRRTAAALLAATLLLAACDSSEERAEEHFQAALELLEQGDSTRAVLEMRNALQLVPTHEAARQLLAETRRAEGDLGAALGHFRSLVEDHPENGIGHLALAEMSVDLGDWDRVEKHVAKAGEILGETPQVGAVRVNLAYRSALLAGERAQRDAAEAEALTLLEADEELPLARRVAIDARMRAEDWLAALELIENGLVLEPDRLELYQIQLGVLEELGRTHVITEQLAEMVERFPDEAELPLTLVRWHLRMGELDAAEAFLRARASDAPQDIDRQTQLVQFLREVDGAKMAIAELERLAGVDGPHRATYRGMRANLMFDAGERKAALAEMTSLTGDLEQEEVRTAVSNDIRVDLARMKALTGAREDARALVTDVLEHDPGHVAALKMLSTWQIEEDKVDEAIVNLRAALRESPRDATIMTLMARAHERAGEAGLQREMLALAVETSNSAPPESLRYAALLLAESRYRPAEDVLVEALRQQPDNEELFTALGRVYVALEDWPRAEQVARSLEQLAESRGNHTVPIALNQLRTQILAGQKRDAELFDFLENLAGSEAGGLAAEIAIIRAHVARGEVEKARDRLDAALSRNPDLPILRFLSATLHAANGEYEVAEAGMEAILAEAPQAEPVWMALYRLKRGQGDKDGATAVLDRALAQLPDAANLLFSRAGELEAAGDSESAIAIYEALYARNSASELVANNLASLLSVYRDDPETLERAYRIGRRLQDSKNPAMRDTYGWIAARLGRFDEAEPHMRFALEGLPEHPVVLYHYGAVLVGLGREEDALEHFLKAKAHAENGLPEADLEKLEAEIARLNAVAEAAETESPTE